MVSPLRGSAYWVALSRLYKPVTPLGLGFLVKIDVVLPMAAPAGT